MLHALVISAPDFVRCNIPFSSTYSWHILVYISATVVNLQSDVFSLFFAAQLNLSWTRWRVSDKGQRTEIPSQIRLFWWGLSGCWHDLLPLLTGHPLNSEVFWSIFSDISYCSVVYMNYHKVFLVHLKWIFPILTACLQVRVDFNLPSCLWNSPPGHAASHCSNVF